MSRTVLIVFAVVVLGAVGGFAALGLTGRPPVQQQVHRDLPFAADVVAATPSVAVPPPPAAPVVTPVVPAAPAQISVAPTGPAPAHP
ncbi:hypothetical protein [Acetobacter okinawensis]|uniref:hypothetical protein n=1 Tax=Acetobacter okinawensis TaxID=1076594 RepID=UPI000A37087E|nr:hypothetical protein [Acetobacter okinawensis]